MGRTGASSHGRKTNISGNVVKVSGEEVITLTHIQYHIHAGDAYIVSDYDDDVDTLSGNEKLWQIMTPNTTARAHVGDLEVAADNEILVELYENPTINSNGVVLIAYNADRNSTNSSTVNFYKDPDWDYNTGTRLSVGKTGASGGPLKTGGTIAGFEWILKQNEDYIIKVTPSNNNTEVTMLIEYDEE